MNTQNSGTLLLSLMAKHGLTLPKNALDWRPAYHHDGTPGALGTHELFGQVTELLTDGCLSWFLLGDHETLAYGHHQNFEPEAKPIEPKKPKSLKPELVALMDID